jgi:hypothetical protein
VGSNRSRRGKKGRYRRDVAVLLIAFAFPQSSDLLWAQGGTYGTIKTFAGIGIGGFSGNSGPATGARLNNPADVAIHPNGDIYIADQANNRIRRIDSNGVITTVAGNGLTICCIDNIPATLASFASPSGIAFDAAGTCIFPTPVITGVGVSMA